jgi:hypothetical protein
MNFVKLPSGRFVNISNTGEVEYRADGSLIVATVTGATRFTDAEDISALLDFLNRISIELTSYALVDTPTKSKARK